MSNPRLYQLNTQTAALTLTATGTALNVVNNAIVSGNVGIGTTNPSHKLSISGNTRIMGVGSYLYFDTTSVNSSVWMRTVNDFQFSIYNERGTRSELRLGNQDIQFFTGDDTERLRITSTGNVGIGITNPGAKFQLVGTGTTLVGSLAYHMVTGTGTAGQGMILGYHTGTGAGGLIAGDGVTGTENNLIFAGYTGSAWQEVMRIKGAGRVLIGTDGSPTTGGFTDTRVLIKQIADGGSGGGLHIEQNGTDRVAYFGFTGNAFKIGTSYRVSATYQPIHFDTGAGAIALSIGTDGNIGIGTTSPSVRLHIHGGTSEGSIVMGGRSDWTSGSGEYAVGRITGRNIGAGVDTTQIKLDGDNLTGTIAFWTASAGTLGQRMVILGSGNVGIATHNPETRLNINLGNGGADGTAAIRIGGTGNYASLELGIFSGYDGMIRSYGNDIRYYSGHWRTVGSSASEDHSHYWFTSRSGSSDWSSIKMRLDHDGNLIVGQNWSGGNLQLSGLLSGYGARTYPTLKTDGQCLYFDAQGTYTGYICYNGGFTDVSDARLKTNITPLTNGLNIIMGLQGVNYAWADGRDDFKQHVGFIAQSVRDVLPEAVTDPHPHGAEEEGAAFPALGVRTPPIVAALVEAVKELKAQNDALKNRVAALEAQ